MNQYITGIGLPIFGVLVFLIVMVIWKKDWIAERSLRGASEIEIDGRTVLIKSSSGIFEFIPAWVPVLGDFKIWMREVHPIYPAVDQKGKISFINLVFGGWRNFIKLFIILLIVSGFLWGVYIYAESARELASHPCIKEAMSTCANRLGVKNAELIENAYGNLSTSFNFSDIGK